MHREKRQNRITEQRKIQKEICRILLIFTMILSMICVVNLTGCRDRKSQEQTELISLDGREPDVEKADGNTAKEAEGSEAGTDDNMTEKDGLKQEKLQICYVHVCGAVKSPGVYELTSDSRLYEAIQMAGGFTDEAAGEALNQAEKIEAEVSLVFTSTSAPTVVDGSAKRSSAVAASVITDRHGHIIHIAKNVTNIFLILLM